ncbi:hypothetical protein C8R45DRAFT_537114 [Mycena sanguinolenta]|nr:hypothetical protein C8R45DRAFT_537114 [Mycena sanguinolenta]
MDNAVLNTTLGALEIGVLVSYMLFGVTTTQTYIYYHRCSYDSTKLKALVAFIWVCESGHVICIGHALYVYTILNYGQPERLAYALPKTILISLFLTAIVSAFVQGFFVFRTYIITKNRYICFIILGLMFLRLLSASALSFLGMEMTLLVQFEKRWGWLGLVGLAVSATIDSIIAVILVVSLRNHSRGVHKRTTALVDKLIAWTIETAAITSVSSIITFLCFVTMTHNFIWLGVQVVSARLFSNSLLTSLNSRAALRETDKVALTLSSLPSAVQPPRTGVNILVTKTSEVMNDTGTQCGSEDNHQKMSK